MSFTSRIPLKGLILVSVFYSVSLKAADSVATGAKEPATLYSLPEWQGMNIVDRRYPGPVDCTFEAQYPNQVKRAGVADPSDLLSSSDLTIGTSVPSACLKCLDRLEDKKSPKGKCVLKECHTIRSRRIEVEPWVFRQALEGVKSPTINKCVLEPSSQRPFTYSNGYQEIKSIFANYYTRPNDDFFQNEKGEVSHGEPYEVAILRGAILAYENVRKRTTDLKFEFKAEVTTGRNVEPAMDYVLHEGENSIPGQKRRSIKEEEHTEKIGEFKRVAYPRGANINSNFEQKMGSVVTIELPLGTITQDGKYFGQLNVRPKMYPEPDEPGATPSSPAKADAPKWKLGKSAKKIDWSVTITDGQITDVSLVIVRTYDPNIKWVQSNFLKVDRTLPEHKHFPQQERRQICGSEKVGYAGTIQEEESQETKLSRQVGKLIVAAGCMDCHGEGNGDKFRFCDETGLSAYPLNDGPFILSAITKGLQQTSRKRYPRDMGLFMEELKKLDEQEGAVIRRWVELQTSR